MEQCARLFVLKESQEIVWTLRLFVSSSWMASDRPPEPADSERMAAGACITDRASSPVLSSATDVTRFPRAKTSQDPVASRAAAVTGSLDPSMRVDVPSRTSQTVKPPCTSARARPNLGILGGGQFT